MKFSNVKVGLTLILVAGASAIIFLQYQTRQKLLAENESLRQQIAQFRNDSQASPPPSEKGSTEDFNELLRLRGEVGALRAQTNQIARLQKQNQQLKDSLAAATEARAESESRSAAHAEEERSQERAFAIVQVNTAKMSVMGMLLYAADNQNQFPTNFDQASAYLANPAVATNLNQFEIVYNGSLANLTEPSSTILIRSRQPWMENGKWAKAYGFVDGHSQVHEDATGNFEEWEQQHAQVLKSQ
jgi:hypothetical protein